MNNFINKTFYKHQSVKCLVVSEDHKISTYYVRPKANTITINTKTFQLDKDNFSIDKKGFITYIFSTKSIASINIHDVKSSLITPETYNVGINSSVASEILNAVKPKFDTGMLMIIMLIVMIAGFGILWYMLSEQLNELKEAIDQIRRVFLT